METNQTFICPKDPENKYFVESCKTIFLKTGLRPWCKTCHHFVQSKDSEAQPLAEAEKESC